MKNIACWLYPEKNVASLLGFNMPALAKVAPNSLPLRLGDRVMGNYRANSELVSKMGFGPSHSLGRLLLDVADHDEA